MELGQALQVAQQRRQTGAVVARGRRGGRDCRGAARCMPGSRRVRRRTRACRRRRARSSTRWRRAEDAAALRARRGTSFTTRWSRRAERVPVDVAEIVAREYGLWAAISWPLGCVTRDRRSSRDSGRRCAGRRSAGGRACAGRWARWRDEGRSGRQRRERQRWRRLAASTSRWMSARGSTSSARAAKLSTRRWFRRRHGDAVDVVVA